MFFYYQSTKKPSILDSFDALDEEDEEEEEEEEDELDEEVSTPTTNTIGKKPSHSFYELKTGVNVSKLNDRNNGSSAAASLLKSTFEDRIKSCQNDTGLMTAIARKSGNMSLTFKPNRNQYGKSDLESVHRGGGDDGDDDKNARRKRGVGSLKLQGGGGSGGGFSGGRGGRGGGRGRGGRGGRGGGRGSSRGGGGSRGGGRGSSRGRH